MARTEPMKLANEYGQTLLCMPVTLRSATWARLLRLPRPYLYAGILCFASLGAYAVNGSAVDLVILLALGGLGLLMRRYGLPMVPAIIGVILGPRADQELRRALQISDGALSGLVDTPFSVTVYGLVVLLVTWPLLRSALRRAGGPGGRGPSGTWTI